MPLIKPFVGLRPAPGRAGEVAAPPYDVLSSAEARALARDKPSSFLHISKPEIDLSEDTDPYSPAVYAQGAANLERLLNTGVLVRDTKAHYYVYRLTWQQGVQTGLVAIASVGAYETQRIRRHEFTRPEKEDDRVQQIKALNAQTGPVFLAYPTADPIDAELTQITAAPPEVDIHADSGVRHELWVVDDESRIKVLSQAFDALGALYIADGHHRSAAAARIATERRLDAAYKHTDSHEYFLAVIFPHHQLRIMDYNRVVKDLNGLAVDCLLTELQKNFTVKQISSAIKPARKGEFSLYVDRKWYQLTIHADLIPADNPVARLDVALLDRYVLQPLFGIDDPRRDKRIDFVGGIRGLHELQSRVDSGSMAAAIALFPPCMQDLMAVADQGHVMPPKSTWFEPKLADGLVSHVLD